MCCWWTLLFWNAKHKRKRKKKRRKKPLYFSQLEIIKTNCGQWRDSSWKTKQKKHTKKILHLWKNSFWFWCIDKFPNLEIGNAVPKGCSLIDVRQQVSKSFPDSAKPQDARWSNAAWNRDPPFAHAWSMNSAKHTHTHTRSHDQRRALISHTQDRDSEEWLSTAGTDLCST